MRSKILEATFGVALIAATLDASAGNLKVPYTFVAGTPVKAVDVNADFAAVATAIDSASGELATVQTAIKRIPAGPQGPAGPTGPQGVQGPAGTGTMLVKDSTGKPVGSYFVAPYDPIDIEASPLTAIPIEFVFLRTTGQSFAVRFTASQIGAGIDYFVLFLTRDCSGQAYLIPGSGVGGEASIMPALSYAAVVNTTAYIAGTTRMPYLQAYSHVTFDGTETVCSQLGSNGISSVLVPVVATFDLSTLGLTPPFSVQ